MDRAEVGREIRRRLGVHPGDHLNHMLALEQQQAEAGLRDSDQPSAALTNLERALSGAEFTTDERRRIRLSAGIDVLADLGLKSQGSKS